MDRNITQLRTVDGETLMSQPLRPPDFVVDSLLSQGLHILAGSPKVGKSWLALWLAVTVAKGEPVWDMAARQGATLYLCLEDSVLRIQNRLFEITEDAPDSVHFCTECRPIGQGLEEQIESLVLDGEEQALSGTDIGKVTYASNAVKDYVDHLKSTVMNSLEGLNIAVDCANGSASVSAERLFTELGANADILHSRPDGININCDCGSTHIERLREYVLNNKLDAGVAYDGDADRCICVDDRGNIVDGDFILAICAKDMKERGKLAKNTVVGTVMTNMGFGRFCKDNGISFVATKVGDRFVLEEMLQEDYNFGGEQSGHVIFSDFASTGDGQLTSIQLLSLVKRSGSKLSELAEVMKRYPQSIINVEVSKEGKLAFYTDPQIKAAIESAKKQFGEAGRIVVRPSGTEPLIRIMTEGEDRALTENVAKSVSEIIKERLGGK